MYRTSEELRVLIKTGHRANVAIEVAGELDAGSIGALRTALDAALELGGDVELELSKMSFCDSTGLCLLLAAQRELRAAGRRLRLVDPAHAMLRLLEISGLREQFEVRTSSSPAVGARSVDVAP